jgi:hypothetical protein
VLALQAELSAKQAQLQALSLDNLALVAKARALEQLVKSAGAHCCCSVVLLLLLLAFMRPAAWRCHHRR